LRKGLKKEHNLSRTNWLN